MCLCTTTFVLVSGQHTHTHVLSRHTRTRGRARAGKDVRGKELQNSQLYLNALEVRTTALDRTFFFWT